MHTRDHIGRALLFTHILTVNTYALNRTNEHVSSFFRHSGSGARSVLLTRGAFRSSRLATVRLSASEARARGRRERLGTLASSFETVQKSVSRVSIARNDAIEPSISTRSTILFRNGDTLGAREETDARTQTCVGLGRTLRDAGTSLFLDVCFCVSRSR